jgi:hypothetical protein
MVFGGDGGEIHKIGEVRGFVEALFVDRILDPRPKTVIRRVGRYTISAPPLFNLRYQTHLIISHMNGVYENML